MSYNLSAQLADNLKFYEEFAGSRAAASFPEKSQVPLVWDLYMDARGPGEAGLTLPAAAGPGPPLDWPQWARQGEAAWPEEPPQAGEGGEDLLGRLNDRLKTQARRYPHPITNAMEALP